MKKRDYLRSLGFRVGDRGRFTDEMKIALAMYDGVFEEDIKPLNLDRLKDVAPKSKKQRLAAPPAQTKGRESRTLLGYTSDGIKVGFVLCDRCKEHMVFCECKNGVYAPSLIKHSTDSLVYVRPV